MPQRHTVQPGECLTLIARRYGFKSYRALYDHPDNAALKKRRPNPNVLHPGDIVVIPDSADKEVEVPTTRVHEFRVKLPRKVLRLALVDHDGAPLTDEPYRLTIGHATHEGRTDPEGKLAAPVEIGETTATLQIAGRTLPLRLGHLNPVKDATDDGVSGAQARLINLGYQPGPVDGRLGPRTRSALSLFQADADLPIHGELDDTTRDALSRAHGC